MDAEGEVSVGGSEPTEREILFAAGLVGPEVKRTHRRFWVSSLDRQLIGFFPIGNLIQDRLSLVELAIGDDTCLSGIAARGHEVAEVESPYFDEGAAVSIKVPRSVLNPLDLSVRRTEILDSLFKTQVVAILRQEEVAADLEAHFARSLVDDLGLKGARRGLCPDFSKQRDKDPVDVDARG